MQWPLNAARGMLRFLDETKIEILLGGLVCTSLGAYLGVSHERERELCKPLAFSEISQIEKDAAGAGKKVDSYTKTYAMANDLVNKVHEAYNEATAEKGHSFTISFAYNLQHIMDPSNREHKYNLFNLCKQVPVQAACAIDEFKPYMQFRTDAASVMPKIAGSWTQRHIDKTHMELVAHTSTVTDSDGKSHTETTYSWEEVYDYTDHYFYFHSTMGAKAVNEAKKIAEDVRELPGIKPLLKAKKTNPAGMKAALESRQRLGENTGEFTDRTFRDIANIWADGSVYTLNFSTLSSAFGQFVRDSSYMEMAKGTALPEYHFRTTSRSHPGPGEYQVFQNAKGNIQASISATDKVRASLDLLKDRVPRLEEGIKGFIDAALAGVEAESQGTNTVSLASKSVLEQSLGVLRKTGQIYREVYTGGMDTETFRYTYVLGLAGAGLLVGTMLGFGLNWLGEKSGAYKRALEKISGKETLATHPINRKRYTSVSI